MLRQTIFKHQQQEQAAQKAWRVLSLASLSPKPQDLRGKM
jgi:hypothetical protein